MALFLTVDKLMLFHGINCPPLPIFEAATEEAEHFFVIPSLYSSTIPSFLKLPWVRKRKYKV